MALGHCWYLHRSWACMPPAPAVLGAPVAIPQASVSLASGTVLQSVLSESPFFPFFRKVSGCFVPRLDKIQQEWAMQGQIRDTRLTCLLSCSARDQDIYAWLWGHTSALGWQTGPVFCDPRIQPLLHELFRSVRILCIFFMNT